MRAALVTILVILAGCTATNAPDQEPPAPSRHTIPFSEANYTTETPQDDSWQIFTINADPEGAVTAFYPSSRLAPTWARSYTIVPLVSDETWKSLEYWGLILLTSDGEQAEIASWTFSGWLREYADLSLNSPAASRLVGDTATWGSVHMSPGNPPGPLPVVLLAYAKGIGGNDISFAVTFQELPLESAPSALATAADQGLLVAPPASGDAVGMELSLLSVERPSASTPCQGDGLAGTVRALGDVQLIVTPRPCGADQLAVLQNRLDGLTVTLAGPSFHGPGSQHQVDYHVQGQRLEFGAADTGAVRYVDRETAMLYEAATAQIAFGVGGAQLSMSEQSAATWEASSSTLAQWTLLPEVVDLLQGPVRECFVRIPYSPGPNSEAESVVGICADPWSYGPFG